MEPCNYATMFLQRFWITLFLVYISCFGLNSAVDAFDQSRTNNMFGIHVATPSREELENAAKLVNTNGGNWGYVTVVIQENDRNKQKWQEAFDRMRELRLIPIVRLATKPIGSTWARPKPDEISNWVNFLDSLNWVVKDRYIVLFNEPNHGQEWEGEVSPEEFADISLRYIKALKTSNSEYFTMLGGLDLAAASNGEDMDEYEFLRRVFISKPELKESIDGLSSHSYPNPGFSGSPSAVGRLSIHGYEWELELLKELGVKKELPVFITETGWIHSGADPTGLDDKFITAFSIWKADPRVRAVTPFILSYQSDPFLQFSWQKPNSQEFYSHYHAVTEMNKILGDPDQVQKGELKQTLPNDLLADSTYHFTVKLRNDGQAVWTSKDGYAMKFAITEKKEGLEYFFGNLDGIKPGDEREIDLYMKTSDQGPARQAVLNLYKNDREVLKSIKWSFRVLPLPSLVIKTSLFPRIRAKKERDFELQIFNNKEELVFKQKGIRRINGELQVPEVKNVYLKGTFRVVILSQYYLPRQTFVRFEKGLNTASIKEMLPLDFFPDGTFSWRDIFEVLKNPRLLGLFLP